MQMQLNRDRIVSEMLSKFKQREDSSGPSAQENDCHWCGDRTDDKAKWCSGCRWLSYKENMQRAVIRTRNEICKNPQHRHKGVILNKDGTENRIICWDCQKMREGNSHSVNCERQAIRNDFARKAMDHIREMGSGALGLPEGENVIHFGKYGYFLNGVYYTDQGQAQPSSDEAMEWEFQFLKPEEYALANEKFGEAAILDLTTIEEEKLG